MRIGPLRHLLTYREPARGTNALGQRTTTGWTEIGTLWAEINAPRSTEALEGAEATATTLREIVTRSQSYQFRATGELLEQDTGRAFKVRGVRPHTNNRLVVVEAVETLS